MLRSSALLLTATLLVAQDAKPAPAPLPTPNWKDKASLSLVNVGGNAESQTFGFSNEFVYNWNAASSLGVNAGAVRVANTTTSYSATGTSTSDYVLSRTEATQVTSENYFANLRFAQNIENRLLWFAGTGWERNRPSGMENRTMVNAGLGYWWIKGPRSSFRTDLGMGYTKENPVVETAGRQDEFSTWNAVLNHEQKIGATSVFSSNLAVTDSVTDSQNYLAVWRNDISATINKRLALKVGYAMTYANRPASKAVDIVDTDATVVGQTSVVLKKLDTIFTASLVFTFPG